VFPTSDCKKRGRASARSLWKSDPIHRLVWLLAVLLTALLATLLLSALLVVALLLLARLLLTALLAALLTTLLLLVLAALIWISHFVSSALGIEHYPTWGRMAWFLAAKAVADVKRHKGQSKWGLWRA
jgi:hypothetical protein